MRLAPLRWPFRIAVTGLSLCGAAALALAAMIASPLRQPPELASITAGVRLVDRSDLPAARTFQARDGTWLAYRLYTPELATDDRIAIVVHGSAGSSINMHAIGKALAASGVRAVAVDIRGHGQSGTRGDIAYMGQLDDDLADFVAHLRQSSPSAPLTLIGHSAGGGFALRIAGSANGDLFKHYVLLAPYLDPFAPTSRPSDGKAAWASAKTPLIIALNLLERLGLPCCGHQPVVAFALPKGSELRATSRYSYFLTKNFGTGFNYKIPLVKARQPITVISGSDDELMFSDRYADAMRRSGLAVQTVIIPGTDHLGMLATPAALKAITDAVKSPLGS